MQLNTASVMTRRVQLSFGLHMHWLLHCSLPTDIAMPFCLSQSRHNKIEAVNLHMRTHLCVALLQWIILGPAAGEMMY